MNKNLSISAFILLYLLPAYTQGQRRCGTEKRMEAYEKLHPYYLQQLDRSFELFKQNNINRTNETLYIPVHIIVVHDPEDEIGQGTNHSVNKILSQIEVLNKDFTRTNADTVNTPDVFSVGNPDIRFCLAAVDPDGNPTDGITRYPSTLDFDVNESEVFIKSDTRWPRETYLNIWIAEIEDLGFVNSLPTTSSLPNSTTDGVVINHVAFGGQGTGAVPPYNLGRTATHEVGHYLGLRHIWRGSGCDSDDGFSDTPIQDTENYDCPVHPSPSCNNGGDMFMNYMDYTDDNCMNAFTAQQSAYMRSVLLGVRSSLIESGATICGNIPLSITIANTKNIECFGNNTGEIDVVAFGGLSPYSYTLDSITNTNGEFKNLKAGEYNVMVTDNSGNSTAINVVINQPTELKFEEAVTNNLCFGENKGKISLTASGGIPVNNSIYFYSLNGVTFGTNNEFQSLANNTYNIHVKDSKNCVVNKSITITSPEKIITSVEVISDIKCFGGNNGILQVKSDGGVSPYRFTLKGNENANGIFENLTAETYQIEITDNNGCVVLSEYVLSQPEKIELINVEITPLNDTTFTITALANGGTRPYNFYLDESSTLQADSIFTSVKGGEHTVWVIDKFGCNNKQTIILSNTEEFEIKDEFSIFPNPVIDNLAIKYNGNKNQEVNIEIFDISGRLLLRDERIKFSLEKNIHNIFVDTIANSILLIKIASKFKSSHILIIKE